MSFNILVTGAGGQLGRSLLRLCPTEWQVTGLTSSELDISDEKAVEAAFKDYQPKLVINAAAYTAVDKAESDRQRAFAVNANGPAYLGRSAAEVGVPVFHVSTDYVFSGQGQAPYQEPDPVGPINVYGASKLAGEQALQKACSQHIILRTSWVFSEYGNNFVKTMLRLGQTRSELGVVSDQRGCPTSAGSLAHVIWQLAGQYQKQVALKWGVYHYSDGPACTWHEFAVEIFRQAYEAKLICQLPIVNAITTTDYPTPAQRPMSSVLDTQKILQTFGVAQADWRDELERVLKTKPDV